MSSRDELLADLAHLRRVLAAKAARTEEMVEKLETEAKHREEERERLVLAAVKPVLKSLADADKAVAKELKLVALDAQMTMTTLDEDLKAGLPPWSVYRKLVGIPTFFKIRHF